MCVAILKTMDEVGFGCWSDGNELIAGGFFQMSNKDFAGIQRVRVEGVVRAPKQGSKDF